MSMKTYGLPDPDGLNRERVFSVESAVNVFQGLTRTDNRNVLRDMLCALMHYCDRESLAFEMELNAARDHYVAETTEGEEGLT